MLRRWLGTASIGGFDTLSSAVGLLAILALSMVRLLSEFPVWGTREERRMKEIPSNKRSRSSREASPKRHFWQYVLETVWAGLSGAAAGCWLP